MESKKSSLWNLAIGKSNAKIGILERVNLHMIPHGPVSILCTTLSELELGLGFQFNFSISFHEVDYMKKDGYFGLGFALEPGIRAYNCFPSLKIR